jgi:hypothetical protein
MKDSIMPHIMNISDPRKIWIKLWNLYQSSSMNRRLSLKSQLYSLKMTEKMSIEEHLRHVSNFTRQLANIGIAIPDDELIDHVLTSLPASWDTLHQMISGRERSPTYDELEGIHILEDSIWNTNRKREDAEEAMIAY